MNHWATSHPAAGRPFFVFLSHRSYDRIRISIRFSPTKGRDSLVFLAECLFDAFSCSRSLAGTPQSDMLNGQACRKGGATRDVFLANRRCVQPGWLTPAVTRHHLSATSCFELLPGEHVRVSIPLSSVSYVDQTHAQ